MKKTGEIANEAVLDCLARGWGVGDWVVYCKDLRTTQQITAIDNRGIMAKRLDGKEEFLCQAKPLSLDWEKINKNEVPLMFTVNELRQLIKSIVAEVLAERGE